ncbi:hypothetical protein NS220_01970 [Microbacterium testaceum]|uniref:Uncharacterized protein n=2 Tax=Microbacterium testaceum TaxID=2033 RepID=A0A147F0V2_MICTE|nr:hypothetical protein NS220_01970 [Microbacterium testaceum]
MSELDAIVKRLTSLRAYSALGMMGAGLLTTAARDGVFRALGWTGAMAPEQLFLPLHRGGHHPVSISEATSVLADADYTPTFWAWSNLLALELGQSLGELRYLDNRPSFEFARHVRNAVAHGGTFDIRHMVGPAGFAEFEIVPALNGTPLADFVSPGDVMALFESVLDDLRNDFLE